MSRKKNISYTRRVLCSSPEAEVVLVTWPKGARSRPHDHGASTGVIKVIRGSVYQDVFDRKTKKFLRRETFSRGESFTETPDIIHIMGNFSRTWTAQTAHIYTPRLVMKEYPQLA